VAQSSPNYWDYLKVPELLDLQGGLEGNESELASDEIHFIIVHQVYELWFKLIIHQLRLARDELSTPRVPEEKIPFVVHHLRRVNAIFQHAIAQFDVVETLAPQDFIDFRDKLVPASGFQSYQYRVLEILLGAADGVDSTYAESVLGTLKRTIASSPNGQAVWAEIEAARAETSLRGALHEWLYRTPIDGSSPGSAADGAAVDRFLHAYLERFVAYQADVLGHYVVPGGATIESHLETEEARVKDFLFAADAPEAVRAHTKRVRASLLFIESYRRLPLLAWPRLLLDTMVELESRLLLWRTRHARMVERIIGQRVGTGGSSGAAYLHQRAQEQIYTELWEIRSILLPRDRVPPLDNADFYGFGTSE
jgi:tryptophan 2,3-dioxygenase